MADHTDDVLSLVQLRANLRSGRAREIREQAGLSQAEVAHAVGASRSAVSLWEAGARLPRGAAAIRYARLLEALSRTGSAAA